jgi:hypothetical protein
LKCSPTKYVTWRYSGDNILVSPKGRKKACISEDNFPAEQIGNE